MYKSELSEAALLKAYDAICRAKGDNPEWAVHKRNSPAELVRCTIPFVGKYYAEQSGKILVYASAENLSGYYPGNSREWVGDWLDDDRQAENRHRRCFDDPELWNNKKNPFFPHVHLEPMNNGCLSTAVYYIASRLYRAEPANPRDFYETIAFGNYGKYSIETDFQRSLRLGAEQGGRKANLDYAGKVGLLAESHEFVKADIETLRPDLIILPASVYRVDAEFINSVKGGAAVLPIYQMNARVINQYIAPNYPAYDVERLSQAVKTWYSELCEGGMTGKSKENYLSVFTYLDNAMENSFRRL